MMARVTAERKRRFIAAFNHPIELERKIAPAGRGQACHDDLITVL
jgi:hypothetical protein